MRRWLLKGSRPLIISSHCRRGLVTGPVSPPPYRILFCGTDSFAKTALTALHEDKGGSKADQELQEVFTLINNILCSDLYSSITVLTAPDAPNDWASKKRIAKSPVKELAQKLHLEHHDIPKKGLAEWEIPSAFTSDDGNKLLLTASFGHLIPPLLTRHFPEAQRLNLHPSLLPELSGAAPIQWAIARQMTTTGVTVQGLGDIFDSGSVYAQTEVTMPEASTYLSLEPILAQEGSRLLVNVLKDLPNYAGKAWPQNKAPKHLIPSRAAKLKSSMSIVRWKAFTASEVEARHRAFGYLYPLTTTLLGSNRVILRELSVIKDWCNLDEPDVFLEEGKCGHAMYSAQTKSLLVKCRKTERSILSITRLQSEGKKEMEAERWIIGYKDRRTADNTLVFES